MYMVAGTIRTVRTARKAKHDSKDQFIKCLCINAYISMSCTKLFEEAHNNQHDKIATRPRRE